MQRYQLLLSVKDKRALLGSALSLVIFLCYGKMLGTQIVRRPCVHVEGEETF